MRAATPYTTREVQDATRTRWDGWLEGTAERNGFVIRRSREYLHDSMRVMYEVGQGRFFFATHEGEPLAAIFVFTFGEKCWYIHGASSNEKRNLMPTYLLQWEVMRWARERGIRYYDMVAVLSPRTLTKKALCGASTDSRQVLAERSRTSSVASTSTYQTGARRCVVQVRAVVLSVVPEAKAERVLLELS